MTRIDAGTAITRKIWESDGPGAKTNNQLGHRFASKRRGRITVKKRLQPQFYRACGGNVPSDKYTRKIPPSLIALHEQKTCSREKKLMIRQARCKQIPISSLT